MSDLLTRKYSTSLITRKLGALNSKCFEQEESLPCCSMPEVSSLKLRDQEQSNESN